MVSTRRAHTSPTPPVTPSVARHSDAPPTSNKKMSREMRRLAIDANPKLGGSASSSAKKARHTDVPQDLQATSQPSSVQQLPHTQLSPHDRVLLTPSPSDSANSPHPRLTNGVAALAHDAMNRPPAPLPSPSATQPLPPQPDDPQDTVPTQSSSAPAKPSIKRKSTIEHYFRALPQQSKSNKRRKIDSPVPEPSAEHAQNAPELLPTIVPPHTHSDTLPEPSAPNTTTEKPQNEPPPTANDEETIGVTEVVTQPAHDQEHEEQNIEKPGPLGTDEVCITAEKEHGNPVTENNVETAEEQKAKAKRERELRRLQIDANPALTGSSPPVEERARGGSKRPRRQTTLPPASEDVDPRPSKRARHSLPAFASSSAAVAGPSSAATADVPSDELSSTILDDMAEVENEASALYPGLSFEQRLSLAHIPNPPTFPAGTDPKLLASGEVNDQWLTQWLGYVALITGDEDTSKVLKENAEYLIKPDRSEETEEERQARIQGELDIISSWPVISRPSSPTQEEQMVDGRSKMKGINKGKGKKKAEKMTAKGKGKAKVV